MRPDGRLEKVKERNFGGPAKTFLIHIHPVGPALPTVRTCPVTDGAMKFAVITAADKIPAQKLEDLKPLIGDYVS